MTITQLEYAVAIATYKSFVAAAEKCFVTQPTLSMQIQKLEEELGVKIFDRNRHPISTTPIGEAIVAQAKSVLTECEKNPDLIQKRQQNLSGVFKIAVIPTLAPYILPELMEQYVAHYPEVRLQIREMETDRVIQSLRNNEIDAGLVSTPLEEDDLKTYPLFYEPFVGYFHEAEKALCKISSKEEL
jgi:LysR family hydrogen peroxide-inducible transcriptional activator